MKKAEPSGDCQYHALRYQVSEIEHCYGKNIHILSAPLLLSHLARLCSDATQQPMLNELLTRIYTSLLEIVVNQEFPTEQVRLPTRMCKLHPKEGYYQGPMIVPNTPVICVNLARAGTLPSQVCYSELSYFMNPSVLRQDHISIARKSDDQDRVTGSEVFGHKIGGSIENAIVLFPDPMGATASTLIRTLDLYRTYGRPAKWIALHCIVTPEYLKKVKTQAPELNVYALRLDRGLSDPSILKTVPGTHWDQERGLNQQSYIVPGGGGIGEVINNAFV